MSKKEHTEQNAMLKLVVCIIVLTAVCSAQEHLTCLRTDDLLNRPIKLLRDQLDSLSQEVEALKNQSRENRQLTVDVFTKGLYIPPHVYIYRLTPGYQSWQQSQDICQNWGGTLAVHGVKTRENRKTLIQNLSISKIYFWIGVNDIASEGDWIWVNGERANSSELIWASGRPNGGRGANCVFVYGFPASSSVGLASDSGCATSRLLGLCEKKI